MYLFIGRNVECITFLSLQQIKTKIHYAFCDTLSWSILVVYVMIVIAYELHVHIPDKKKKRTTTIFPLRSPFNTKMLIVMKYLFLIKSN